MPDESHYYFDLTVSMSITSEISITLRQTVILNFMPYFMDAQYTRYYSWCGWWSIRKASFFVMQAPRSELAQVSVQRLNIRISLASHFCGINLISAAGGRGVVLGKTNACIRSNHVLIRKEQERNDAVIHHVTCRTPIPNCDPSMSKYGQSSLRRTFVFGTDLVSRQTTLTVDLSSARIMLEYSY